MRDAECVRFLQWALPRLHMRWDGFRKVRGQVCKRLKWRLDFLGINELDAYPAYLERNPAEWSELDRLCQITISRFYRDKLMYKALEQQVLPRLAGDAASRGDNTLHVWSAGCASGEEPYTVALIWKICLAARFPHVGIRILASDADAQLLMRAQRACYAFSAVKNLPASWRELAFHFEAGAYCLQPQYRAGVEFRRHDIRSAPPHDYFDLILCRNLVLTYFDEPLQQAVITRLRQRLRCGGFLVTGIHEKLPPDTRGLIPYLQKLGIYATNERA